MKTKAKREPGLAALRRKVEEAASKVAKMKATAASYDRDAATAEQSRASDEARAREMEVEALAHSKRTESRREALGQVLLARKAREVRGEWYDVIMHQGS